MAKGCALSTGYLPRGGLPRNSVDRITDRPDMTSAVDSGRKASTQTNKQKRLQITITPGLVGNCCCHIKANILIENAIYEEMASVFYSTTCA